MNDLIKETDILTDANASGLAFTSSSSLLTRGYYTLLYNLSSGMLPLNKLISNKYLEVYGRASRSASINSIECFTYNLVKAIKLSQTEISVSLDKNKYNGVVINGKLISNNVGHEGTTKLLSLFEREGLISVTKGYRIETPFGIKSKSGYITLTQDLVKLVEDYVDPYRVQLGVRVNVIILRNDKQSDIQFTSSKYTREVIKVLTRYNKMMDRHLVEYNGVRLDTGLARIFNNDFNSGGRLYASGGSYQTIPSQMRSMIKINGVETAEVDIKGSHISILHTMVGSRLLRGYDPYDIDMDGIAEYDMDKMSYMLCSFDEQHNPFRNLVKVALLIMVNADSQKKASMALKAKLDSHINISVDVVDDMEDEQVSVLRMYGLKDVNIPKLFTAIKTKHHAIKEYFFSGAGVWLQKMEGDIFTNVIDKCIENDYPVLVIHDSCRAKIDNVKAIGEFIESAWLGVVGDTCNLTLEYEF